MDEPVARTSWVASRDILKAARYEPLVEDYQPPTGIAETRPQNADPDREEDAAADDAELLVSEFDDQGLGPAKAWRRAVGKIELET